MKESVIDNSPAYWRRYIRWRIGSRKGEILRIADLAYHSDDPAVSITNKNRLLEGIMSCFTEPTRFSKTGDQEEENFETQEAEDEPGADQDDIKDFVTYRARNDDLVFGSMARFYEKRFLKYRPNESFWNFLVFQLAFCIMDQIHEDTGYELMSKSYCKDHKEEYRGTEDAIPTRFYGRRVDSYDVPLVDDEGESANTMLTAEEHQTVTMDRYYALTPDERYEENEGVKVRTARVLAGLMRMSSFFTGQANNPTRRNYMHLFFSELISRVVRNDDKVVPLLAQHEREFLGQMKPLFLLHTLTIRFPRPALNEFYLSESGTYCALRDIQLSELKNKNVFFPGEPAEPMEDPVPDVVLISYLKDCEDVKSSPALISQNRGYFEDLMRKTLEAAS